MPSNSVKLSDFFINKGWSCKYCKTSSLKVCLRTPFLFVNTQVKSPSSLFINPRILRPHFPGFSWYPLCGFDGRSICPMGKLSFSHWIWGFGKPVTGHLKRTWKCKRYVSPKVSFYSNKYFEIRVGYLAWKFKLDFRDTLWQILGIVVIWLPGKNWLIYQAF